MSYVDGVVMAVPHANKEAFRQGAARMAPVYLEHGAIDVAECWGDDVPHGKLTDFHMATKATGEENIVLSWVLWPSKAVRDAAWPKMMEDERMRPGADGTAIFDGARMFWGGFERLDLNQ